MHDKANIYTTYGLSCKERLYSGLSALKRFIMRKTAYDILFTFDKLGILIQFSCYHMPYVSNNV